MNSSLLTRWGPNNHLAGRWASLSVCAAYVDPYPPNLPVGTPPPVMPVNGAPGVTTLNFNGTYIGGRINVNSCQDLEYLNFPNMTTCDSQFFLNNNPKLKEVSFPSLQNWQTGLNRKATFSDYFILQIAANNLLTNINFGPWVPNGSWDVYLQRNISLPQSVIDSIVMRFVNATDWKTPAGSYKAKLDIWGCVLPSAGVQAAANVVNADASRNVIINWLYP